MSLKNNKRSFINNFVWYCSGLNVRELSSLYQSRSNYFGIGGITIFSTLFIAILSGLSFHISFPIIGFIPSFCAGFIIGFLIFVFNRQTVSTLSISDRSISNSKHSLTFIPLLLFSIFIGFIISTPFKFQLFGVPEDLDLFNRLSKLNIETNSSIDKKIASMSITIITILLSILPSLIQYYSLRSHFQKNRSSMLNELMWFCSGANKDIIRKCPNDHTKYFGIGGTILFTALMASISGGYAFFTAFHDAGIAVGFGAFWGAMIFNLDRFIVNTMYSDDKHTISGLELLSGLPRIIISIFLGIVISYPLEMKIFEDSINLKMEYMKVQSINAHKDSLNKTFAGMDKNAKKNARYESKKEVLKNEIDFAYAEWQAVKPIPVKHFYTDNDGVRQSYIKMENPPSYKIKKDRYDQINTTNTAEISSLNDKIQANEIIIKREGAEKDTITDDFNAVNTSMPLFAKRLEAFEKLKTDPNNKSVASASLFIMILLIILEISPVFFKMMLSSGDYDEMLKADKNEIKTRELVRISRDNDWANTEILKTTEENKKKITDKQNELNNELNSNLELLGTIAKAQSEIAQIAIEKWKQDEIKKASLNPMNIIQSNATASTLSFEDKFWLYNDTTEEYTYVFKSGNTNELWLKNKDIVNIGKWLKVNSNQLEIELNSDKKIYDIEELTDATFLLCESGTTNKLQLTAV